MENILKIKLSFAKRPIPIPAEYRPMYKIALIVIILKYCCIGESANLTKLHLFSWALSSEENMNEIIKNIENGFQDEFAVWGVDPSLNRALQLAVAENICEIQNGKKYKLTHKGNKFFEMIESDKFLFDIEKSFLINVGKKSITDRLLESITKKWNLAYVKN